MPKSSAIQLVWSPGGRTSSAISTTAYTDRAGRLSATFPVPASPLGTYTLTALAADVPYASTRYVIKSPAKIKVTVSTAHRGERLLVQGRHFFPRLRVILIAAPIYQGKEVQLGETRADRAGNFHYALVTGKLAPGEYTLHALSTSASSADAAEAFFQVII